MTDAVQLGLIGGIASVMVTISTTIGLVIVAKINKVYTSVNSRMDELLELTKAVAFAEGIKHRHKDQT